MRQVIHTLVLQIKRLHDQILIDVDSLHVMNNFKYLDMIVQSDVVQLQ